MAFGDLSGFFTSEEWKRVDRAPVVFLGIDGATWSFIDPFIEVGELPNLKRLKEEGAYGALRSISCYVSPPAWTTMLSGYLPEKTGVYTFGKWDGFRQEFTSVNSDDIAVPLIWDVASHGGRKVGVFNVPMTYPARPVNGVMVTGLMTPIDMGDPPEGHRVSSKDLGKLLPTADINSYSPIRRTTLDDSLNVFLWALYDTVDDRIKEYDKVVLTVISKGGDLESDRTPRSYTFDVGGFSPWIQIRSLRNGKSEKAWWKASIVKTPDGRYDTQLSPTFYSIDAPYTYPDTLAEFLQTKFNYYLPTKFVESELLPDLTKEAAHRAGYFYDLDYWDLYLYVFTQSDNIHHLTGFSPMALEVYRAIDRYVGEIMEKMPDGGTLIIASDHGFGEYSYGVDLNLFLEKLGLMRWRDRGEIDYDNSLVYYNIWHLYFNHDLITREELEKRGIDLPPSADPVEFLVRYLQEATKSMESTDGSMAVSLELRPLPDGAVGEAPDMIVEGTYGDYLVDFLGFANPHSSVFRELKGIERSWHKRDGIYVAWGKNVRRGFNAGTKNIQDVAPTVLYCLGLPIAADMDGEVMIDIFERRSLAEKPIHLVDDYSQIPRKFVIPDADRELLQKKLLSLGYLQ